jgi:hypothetical protein
MYCLALTKSFHFILTFFKQPGAPVSRTTQASTQQTIATMNIDELSYSNGDIGVKIQVYKYRYDHWYEGVVVGFDRQRKMHCVQYDDGDKQWHVCCLLHCMFISSFDIILFSGLYLSSHYPKTLTLTLTLNPRTCPKRIFEFWNSTSHRILPPPREATCNISIQSESHPKNRN